MAITIIPNYKKTEREFQSYVKHKVNSMNQKKMFVINVKYIKDEGNGYKGALISFKNIG